MVTAQGVSVIWNRGRSVFTVQRLPSASRGIERKEWAVPFHISARVVCSFDHDPSQDVILVLTAPIVSAMCVES